MKIYVCSLQTAYERRVELVFMKKEDAQRFKKETDYFQAEIIIEEKKVIE